MQCKHILTSHFLRSVVRASLGAMSTVQDVDTFISFLEEVFVEGRRAVHHHEEHGHHDYGVHHHHQSYVVDQPTKISCDVADLPVPAYAVSSASSPSLSTAADQQRAVAASA